MFWGSDMQVIDISGDLNGAIISLEKLLNGEDGEKILETIKRYKVSKQDFDGYSSKPKRK